MTTSLDSQYVERAEENEDVLGLLDPGTKAHRPWVATLAFYAAVRYVDSLIPLAEYGVRGRRHASRLSKVAQHAIGPSIEGPFESLYEGSLLARYSLYEVTEADAAAAVEDLAVVKQHILAYGRNEVG